jgi:hypothetical protein
MFDEIASWKPEPEHRYYGPGFVCAHLQIVPAQLLTLVEAAGVKFSLAIDGVPMLDGHGFLAVADKCEEVRAEIQSVVASAAKN